MLNKKQIAGYFLTIAQIATYTPTNSAPSETIQNVGLALASACGTFLCYKFASNLRHELLKNNFIEKALYSIPLHLSSIGIIGCTYCTLIYMHKANSRVF